MLSTRLRRFPDYEATELHAVDAADRMLLEYARQEIVARKITEVTVIGDRYGALTLGLLTDFPQLKIRVFQDNLIFERALAHNAQNLETGDGRDYSQNFVNYPLGTELLQGAELVLLRLPKSLSELREIADAVARFAAKNVTVVAGGRVKHMTLQMNDVLREYFTDVTASLAKQKSRLLFANTKKGELGQEPFPQYKKDPELDFELATYGATFGANKFDHGTRILLQKLLPELERLQKEAPSATLRAVDLGCGNGVVATTLATKSNAEIIATDVSHAAVLATTKTLEKAGALERVIVSRADACETVPAEWADLIVLNPPFHSGTEVNNFMAKRLIVSAFDALRKNGELWLVMNSHLKSRAMLSWAFTDVTQVVRNKKFTVLKAVKK